MATLSQCIALAVSNYRSLITFCRWSSDGSNSKLGISLQCMMKKIIVMEKEVYILVNYLKKSSQTDSRNEWWKFWSGAWPCVHQGHGLSEVMTKRLEALPGGRWKRSVAWTEHQVHLLAKLPQRTEHASQVSVATRLRCAAFQIFWRL